MISRNERDRVNDIVNGIKSSRNVIDTPNDKRKSKFWKLLIDNDDNSYHEPEPEIKFKPKLWGCASLLIVDDQIINRMILLEFGNSLGIVSDEAENGKVAYNLYWQQAEKACWQGYQLILMDLNMPVMTGMRATQKILSKPTFKHKPHIWAVTAFASDDEKEKWFSVGFDDFQTKPIDFQAFIKIVSKFL